MNVVLELNHPYRDLAGICQLAKYLLNNDAIRNVYIVPLENMREFFLTDEVIIDIAIFEGKKPTRSSKFYKFDPKNNSSVEKITTEVLSLLNREEISESEKGEIVLNVLKKIMKFENIKNKKDTA